MKTYHFQTILLVNVYRFTVTNIGPKEEKIFKNRFKTNALKKKEAVDVLKGQ